MTDSSDRPGDEPSLSGEEWGEYGGELIWTVDFTPGGVPIGLTSKVSRRINAEPEHRAGWARAKALPAWAFEACSYPVGQIEVGRVEKIGEGLFRKVAAAHVGQSPDPDHPSGVRAVLLRERRATTEEYRRWVREVTILGQLAREGLPFRVPAALGEHCRAARRYREALRGRGSGPPERAPAKLLGILRRARESTP